LLSNNFDLTTCPHLSFFLCLVRALLFRIWQIIKHPNDLDTRQMPTFLSCFLTANFSTKPYLLITLLSTYRSNTHKKELLGTKKKNGTKLISPAEQEGVRDQENLQKHMFKHCNNICCPVKFVKEVEKKLKSENGLVADMPQTRTKLQMEFSFLSSFKAFTSCVKLA